ncbi:MAG: zinc ribbon domain-containing protein [Verrucomicrobia bacterium]|nr:zinc ribbon domain-containing protein [Verrucomicrobiota bacterium]
MPTYEYTCKKCGHEFEAVHSMAAPSLKICPEDSCGLKKWGRGSVSKKIGAGAGLLFKGSGFYITDYRSEGYKSAAKKDSTDSKPAAKSEAKSDAKPAKKADKK